MSFLNHDCTFAAAQVLTHDSDAVFYGAASVIRFLPGKRSLQCYEVPLKKLEDVLPKGFKEIPPAPCPAPSDGPLNDVFLFPESKAAEEGEWLAEERFCWWRLSAGNKVLEMRVGRLRVAWARDSRSKGMQIPLTAATMKNFLKYSAEHRLKSCNSFTH